MHRIDGPGATGGNLFTEGNPALGIPATVVTDDWANDVQEEIVNVIEDQGITLVKGTQDQLLSAIKSLIGFGGDSQLNVSLANDTGPFNVTGLSFNKANVKSAVVPYNIERKTDTQNVQETGHLYIAHDSADDIWRLSVQSGLDDAGVTFSITSGGQVQATTDDLTGTSYSGNLRIGQVLSMKQTV